MARPNRSPLCSLALRGSVMLACLAGATGCGDTPRSRLGALPFPGPFTLYTTADPDRLGRHRYGHAPRVFRTDEKERGLIYTTRAGFIDMAHLRMTIDWTRYYTRKLRAAIVADRHRVKLAAMEDCPLYVTLNYPSGWRDLEPAERARFADKLALRGGQRLAYLSMSWHEIATWFGHRSVFFIDESPSAFTWDDTMSHVIGLRVAAAAMRDYPDLGYDNAVTAALDAELHRLGAVKPKQTTEAARAVEGKWWADGEPLKRQFGIGTMEFVVYPWLIPGLPFAPADVVPEPVALETLADIEGLDASGFITVEIDPRIDEAEDMRKLIPGHPRRFNHYADIPALLEAMQQQMRDKFGADVNIPWPAPPETAPTETAPTTEPSTLPTTSPTTEPAAPPP
jgi:hypothetical protein